MARTTIIILSLFLFAFLLQECRQEDYPFDLPEVVDYNFHVKPILSDRCFSCHGPDKNQRKADLRLDMPEGLFKQKLESGGVAVKARNLKKSEAFQRLLSHNPDLQMPPPESNLSLSEREIRLLEKWIKQGAPYSKHWAYIKPEKKVLPKVKNKDWPQNPIDHFVLAKLEQKGLQPAPSADKETLLRRLVFDLTGLPPSIAEIDAFLADDSPDAYEKVVDRLLNSPAYGERLAMEWLDLARYADTHGYTVDRYRDMSPWRDWVIQAFNDNQPFDEFVKWQLAGDLLPEPSREQLIATAFNRNHPQNAEGGIVPEEFRVEYVANRTETFGTAFLGMTMNCARCHDHKYDPIEQKEFYSLFSFFNNVDESGQITFSTIDIPAPTLLLTDEEVDRQLGFMEEQIGEEEREIADFKEKAKSRFDNWLKNKPLQSLPDYPRGMAAYFPLDQNSKTLIHNQVNPKLSGKILDPVTNQIPENPLVSGEGYRGQGILLNGDDAIAFPGVGKFDRAHPFSVSIWVKIPEKRREGVIFHANRGGIIYNFKGYQVSLEKDLLDVRLAHAFPYNAIHLISQKAAPKKEWIHLTLTYDGSSDAAGVKLYLNGEELEMLVKRNELYKDIVFQRERTETYLKVGARWRTMGLKDAWADEARVFNRRLTPLEVEWIYAGNPIPRLLAKESDWTTKEKTALFDFYCAQYEAEYQALLDALQEKRTKYNATVEPVRELMIMRETSEPKPAFVLNRGQYDSPAEEVFPATPKQILPFPDDLPKNRLGLARWLFHPDHPLTARVTVNRYWQLFFGRGLVETAEDFGNQGALPTHPDLLDWLAIRFQEENWNIKSLLKQIVLSATYRQSSRADETLLEIDPNNELLARGPRQRLTAEMMRDNALAASGLLVRKIGGPSVRPYQPSGLWRFNSGRYVQDHGDSLYRRSLYTIWKRTVPPPTMNTFDAPDRSYCIARRQKTSTPLQALILLNDPQYVEAARVLAQNVMLAQKNPSTRIQLMYRKLSGRQMLPEEAPILQELYERSLAKYRTQSEKTNGLLAVGEFPLTEELDRAELAATTIVASAIMNHDACVIKR